MHIKRNSLAVRYYVFLLRFAGKQQFEIEWHLGRVSDLCQFVRSLVLRTLGLLFVVTALLAVLTALAIITYQQPLAVIGVFVGIPTIAAAAVGAVTGIRAMARRRAARRPDGIALTYIKAVKRGICPLLTIERD